MKRPIHGFDAVRNHDFLDKGFGERIGADMGQLRATTEVDLGEFRASKGSVADVFNRVRQSDASKFRAKFERSEARAVLVRHKEHLDALFEYHARKARAFLKCRLVDVLDVSRNGQFGKAATKESALSDGGQALRESDFAERRAVTECTYAHFLDALAEGDLGKRRRRERIVADRPEAIGERYFRHVGVLERLLLYILDRAAEGNTAEFCATRKGIFLDNLHAVSDLDGSEARAISERQSPDRLDAVGNHQILNGGVPVGALVDNGDRYPK